MALLISTAPAADVWRGAPAYPNGGMDTWFGSYYNTSAQHDYRLRVGGWGDYYYSLLRFNLSGLPRVATRAVIWVYAINDGGTPTPINWWKVNQSWQSGSVSYSNFPWFLTYLGQTTAPTPGYWYGVNITSFYNAWRAGTPGSQNYGFVVSPQNNNNNYSSFSSSKQIGYGPELQVTYTPQSNDNIIKLKWPLASPSYANRVVTVGGNFGANWNNTYCGGLIKKHNGTDFQASAGTAVYAAEDGIVKEVLYDDPWAYNIVLEHYTLSGGNFTTVYWHVIPTSGIAPASSGQTPVFVPKGMQIGTVANLGGNTHFHLGVRNGVYAAGVSGTGGLPQNNCSGYPAFPANFIDPNNTNNVIFN